MKFEGHVTRIELFGAFVDIGAERDGLVHVSQISEQRVNRVADVLKDGDPVTVWVQRVDPEQGRISLTMKQLGKPGGAGAGAGAGGAGRNKALQALDGLFKK